MADRQYIIRKLNYWQNKLDRLNEDIYSDQYTPSQFQDRASLEKYWKPRYESFSRERSRY
jgi:hypothetical protein